MTAACFYTVSETSTRGWRKMAVWKIET